MTTLREIAKRAMRNHVRRQGASVMPLRYLIVGNEVRISDPETNGFTIWGWKSKKNVRLFFVSEYDPNA